MINNVHMHCNSTLRFKHACYPLDGFKVLHHVMWTEHERAADRAVCSITCLVPKIMDDALDYADEMFELGDADSRSDPQSQ